MNMSFLFFFSFCCCCTTTKDSKVPPGKSAGRITPHTFQAPRIWDWSEVFNCLSSGPMSSSFYHCQNQSSAFVLKKKTKKNTQRCLMKSTFFLATVASRFFVLPHRKCERRPQSVPSKPLWKCKGLQRPVEYIVMVLHQQNIVLSPPPPLGPYSQTAGCCFHQSPFRWWHPPLKPPPPVNNKGCI